MPLYPDYMTEEEKKRANARLLMGLGGRMMAGAGPQPVKQGLASIAGKSILGGLEDYDKITQDASTQRDAELKRKAAQMQLEQQKQVMQGRNDLANFSQTGSVGYPSNQPGMYNPGAQPPMQGLSGMIGGQMAREGDLASLQKMITPTVKKAPKTRQITKGDKLKTQEWNESKGEWRTIAEAPRTAPDFGDAPKTRTKNVGDKQITEEWNRETKQWVQIAEAPRYKLGVTINQSDPFKASQAIGKDYARDIKTTIQAEQDIAAIRGLLADKNFDANTAQALKTKLSSLYDAGSRSMAENEAWKNRGNLIERFKGSITGFISGTPTKSQKESIKKLVDNYEETVVKPIRGNIDSHYREKSKRFLLNPEDILMPSFSAETSLASQASSSKKAPPTSAAQIREDGRKYGWTEKQIEDQIKYWGF